MLQGVGAMPFFGRFLGNVRKAGQVMEVADIAVGLPHK